MAVFDDSPRAQKAAEQAERQKAKAPDANAILREQGPEALRDHFDNNRHVYEPEDKTGSSANGTDAGADANGHAAAAAPKRRKAVLVRADKIEPESIAWAWQNRFAFGKLGMLAGDPGLGKSTILIDIAAMHSRGARFPCGEGVAAVCDTLFLTAEDGLADTLVPRLMAAEADLSKIRFLTGTWAEGDESDVAFNIARDTEVLADVLTDNPSIKLIIIDPLTAYLGPDAKAKENADVRRVLTPLAALAERFGTCIICNNHLNKSAGKALYRVLDSIAFVAVQRTLHLVVADDEVKGQVKLICSKSNIGVMPKGLTYVLQGKDVTSSKGEVINTSVVSWGTEHIDETADEALGGKDESTTTTDAAQELLNEILAGGPMAVPDIEAEARAAGMLGEGKKLHDSKPFRTAFERLGLKRYRTGFGPGATFKWSRS